MITFTAQKSAKLSKIILKEYPLISYSKLMKLYRDKDIKVNGVRINKDQEICSGDKVEIYYNPPEKSCYREIFCDKNILVINKESGFLSEEVYDKIKLSYVDAKFIHRLDRNTSGLMIFALNETSEKELLLGFKNHDFDKRYKCVVKGKLVVKKAILNAFLVKDKGVKTVKIFDKKVPFSVPIKTGYEVLCEDEETSTLNVKLFTGKTHQIRAHLAYIGHPIVGDEKYGDGDFNKKFKLKKQALISNSLTLKFDKNSPLYYLNGKTFILEN